MSTIQSDVARYMAKDNVELPAGAGSILWKGLSIVGLVLTALAVVGGLSGDAQAAKTAIFALHTGFAMTIGFPLASLVLVMILNQTGAGWSATIRRQFENIMSLIWLPGLMFAGILVLQAVYVMRSGGGEDAPYLWSWMNPAHTAGDPIYLHKQAYLNFWFFLARALTYFAIWCGLAFWLYNLSTRQDVDGDRWHTATSRKISAVGIPLFAFSAAFAGFDWIMTLDYHWFSTMLGVHFFARAMVAALALGTLVLIALRSFGRLHGAFTNDHLHDLSKLMFAFIVFWAYISFSQYFLIWYANIPEETMFFQIRKTGAWTWMSWVIPICHFILPFIILLPRPWRRSRTLMAVMCVYMIAIQTLDTYWMIRPDVAGVGPGAWVDIPGVLGPMLIFFGFMVRKVASGPLIPLHDPRLDEALHHKNYV